MAACGSLQHIFEKPLPESPSLLDSLSWNQSNSLKSIEQSSLTELFGELHFKENSSKQYRKNAINGDNFSPRKCESLQLCTEGLGFESFDYVEDLKNDINEEKKQYQDESTLVKLRNTPLPENPGKKFRAAGGGGGGGFPPPISCIGKSGKPWVSFKSYREDGRFVLKQVKMASQEFLHAHREDGRLKLHFVQPTDEILEEDDEEKNPVEEYVKDENRGKEETCNTDEL